MDLGTSISLGAAEETGQQLDASHMLPCVRLSPPRRCPSSTSSALWFFSSRRRHTRCYRYWSSDVCSSDLMIRRPKRCYRDWSSDVCSSDRKSTRLNSSHGSISDAVFLLKKKNRQRHT